jgi:hypothetical protein
MIQALTRAQVIKQWPVGGDFTLTDLWTGEVFTCRGSAPVNYDHSDWMYKTKTDFDISRKICSRSWGARPAVLRTPSGCISAVSYHTLNHSIVVASNSYEIVSPRITRATERDKNGNWVPGHHMCMHYEDSWKARTNTAYTRDMRDKVALAVLLANAEQQDDKEGIIDMEDGILKTIYNQPEQVPLWARPTIQKLVDAKIVTGVNDAGDLNFDENMIRTLVILDRAGAFASI